MAKYAVAIDQGTTSTRCMVFNYSGGIVCFDQKEHEQIYPKPGWVEHSPEEVWERTRTVTHEALRKGNIDLKDVAAVGITNQRETAVVWNRKTGRAYYNASGDYIQMPGEVRFRNEPEAQERTAAPPSDGG